MRELRKPSTAHCSLRDYVSYLRGEPLRGSCRRLGEMIEITHDSVNRFLWRENYTSEDLFNEIRGKIELERGILSVDDTVIDKPYSTQQGIIDYYWSGKHKRVILGINLITLYYTDPSGVSVPVSFRIYKTEAEKSKHDYFREMITEVKAGGIKAESVTGDSWYASIDNLKFIREEGLGFRFGIERHRKISLEIGSAQPVQRVEIPAEGLNCYLPKFGEIKVYQQKFKEEPRYYIMYLPKIEKLRGLKREEFERVHDTHWGIEQYHRVLKPVCNLEGFQVRTERAIRNHIFSALCGYVQLSLTKARGEIANCYEISRTLFLEVIAKFIRENSERFELVNSHS